MYNIKLSLFFLSCWVSLTLCFDKNHVRCSLIIKLIKEYTTYIYMYIYTLNSNRSNEGHKDHGPQIPIVQGDVMIDHVTTNQLLHC